MKAGGGQAFEVRCQLFDVSENNSSRLSDNVVHTWHKIKTLVGKQTGHPVNVDDILI